MPALVVNADDLGMSQGATAGILQAHREGIVTSASLSVTTSHYRHAVDACRSECPDLGIGLHFNLTAGRPVCPADEVPLLTDAAGYFSSRFVPLLFALHSPRREPLRHQIALELEAQIRRATEDGVVLDHLDSERHIHLIPGIFDLVVEAASRHAIRFVRCGRDVGWRYLRLQHLGALLRNGGGAKTALLSGLSRGHRKRTREVSHARYVASYLYTGRLELLLPTLIAQAPTDGITEIMVHPGVPESSQDVALGNRGLEHYLRDEGRRRELEACIRARDTIDRTLLASFGQLAQATAS